MPTSYEPLTEAQADNLAAQLNTTDRDYYGNPWTGTSVSNAQATPGADPNQSAKLIRLLALIAIATG